MNPIATIYIPYSDAHKSVVEYAFRSASNQTVKCEVVMGASPNTPALLRNQAMNAKTPFVTWLDADDTLAPNFVEECLKAYQQGRYVYTSWMCGSILQKPNLCVGYGNDKDYHSHLVTTLYPSIYFKLVGGFDETLKGHEDVDFYLRSAQKGICGIHLDKPLVHYSDNGQRSKLFTADTKDMKDTMDTVYLRNGGQKTIMGCCGGAGQQAQANPGDQQPGDVLATALWAGLRSEVGLSTGRVYRGGNQGTLWVALDDIVQRPDLFKVVPNLRELAPKKELALKEAGLLD